MLRSEPTPRISKFCDVGRLLNLLPVAPKVPMLFLAPWMAAFRACRFFAVWCPL